MHINPTSHSHIESHTITHCMHDQHSVQNGGMSFQTEMQQSVKIQPQTVEESLQELAAINKKINSQHKIFGTGNTFGNVISDVTGDGAESIVVPMADNSASADSNSNANMHVTADMLNAIVMPRKKNVQSSKTLQSNTTTVIVTSSDATSGNQLQERKKGFIPFNTNGIKKRLRKWIQTFPKKIFNKENKQVTKNKEMKPLTREYILDSYDKSGQYHQLDKSGIVNDILNEKV